MRATWTILKREVYSFFASPLAYIVLTVWVLLTGFGFFQIASVMAQRAMYGGEPTGSTDIVGAFFGSTVLFYLPIFFIVPVFTMRLLAEERSRGTIEVLMTAPVSDVSIVFGKYLAALVFWAILWAPTLLYVWLGSRYGAIDVGAVAASYVAVFGLGASYMAIGLLMSAIAKNQIVAAVLTFLMLCGLFLLGLGVFVFPEEYRDVFGYVSVWVHMEAFSKGIVDTRYLVFDASLAAVCVTLTIGLLSARRVEE